MSSAFQSISAKHQNRLAKEDAYFGSDDFQTRIAFEGEQGVADKVAILHFMLDRVALEPNSGLTREAELADGVVNLHFFGFSNPVGLFYLPPGPVLDELIQHVKENLESKMMQAAVRVRAWRTGEKSCKRRRQEDSVLGLLRSQLTWPGKEDYAECRVRADAAWGSNLAAMDVKLLVLRQRRNLRLARLAQAAAPGVTSWTGLLEDIALSVLPPLR